jgi:nucleoside-diphosphate-sugar epimerase
MRIAITGGSGGLGRVAIALALAQGYSVVNIDQAPPGGNPPSGVRYVQADITDFNGLQAAMAGCDALIHLAAITRPGLHRDHETHNINVVGSYNALLAAAELGIRRICQASSVNAIGHAFSRAPRYDYFPLDEAHPSYNEDPYSLSKWLAEQQAASLCRRYDDLRVASLRFHWVTSTIPQLDAFRPELLQKNLWSYVLAPAAARACLLSLTADFRGHEPFFIVAPQTLLATPSLELARAHHPGVPIVGDLSGNRSFFSSAKAARLLGWRHDPEV